MSDLMQLLVSEHGEALHLHHGEAPVLEVQRVLHRIEGPSLTASEIDELLHAVAQEDNLSELKSGGMVCFYFHFGDAAVFQVMAFREDGHVRLEVRKFR